MSRTKSQRKREKQKEKRRERKERERAQHSGSVFPEVLSTEKGDDADPQEDLKIETLGGELLDVLQNSDPSLLHDTGEQLSGSSDRKGAVSEESSSQDAHCDSVLSQRDESRLREARTSHVPLGVDDPTVRGERLSSEIKASTTEPKSVPKVPVLRNGNGNGHVRGETVSKEEHLPDTCPLCKAKLDRIVFDKLDAKNNSSRRLVMYAPCNCGNYFKGGVVRDNLRV